MSAGTTAGARAFEGTKVPMTEFHDPADFADQVTTAIDDDGILGAFARNGLI